jgi:signal transduction histidine kinase
MSGAAIAPGGPAGRPGSRPGFRAGVVAAVHGLEFGALALAGAGLLLALAAPVALAALGLGLFVSIPGGGGILVLRAVLALAAAAGLVRFGVPAILLAIRRLASLTRRLAGEWCGVPVALPYRPPPGPEVSFGSRLGWLLTDEATWRDLLWISVNASLGWILAVAPAALAAIGLVAFIAPVVGPGVAVAIPPPAFPGNQPPVLIAAGLLLIATGLLTGGWLLRGYGALARLVLAPAGRAELASRVRHLARTRAETLDSGAAELRRIERDLHDGAQARLVAMGMTLGAAEQLVGDNPAAARALLLEARDSSVKALAELRDLVRGIHPPVLADRGLADAVRALALDTALRVHLTSELAGRPPASVESAAYFAVSELLANVAKHASADQAWIDIRYAVGMLRISVSDDGCGGADPARGTGLRGTERRLAAFDGVLALSSPPGGPTAVNLEIPCALSSPKTSSC